MIELSTIGVPMIKDSGGWKESNPSRLALLCLGFGVFFYLGYYAWWPFIFLSTTPLVLCAESRHVRWATGFAILAGTATVLLVYRFFAAYSPVGLCLISAYHGLTIGCVVLATHALRRWTRLPYSLLFPPLWTGGEYWRMLGETGLPLGLLAPPTGNQLWMIQICDLGGLYLLSFAIAMLGASLADQLLKVGKHSKTAQTNSFIQQAGIGVVAVWGVIAIYGNVRLNQASRTMHEGPVLSVIQPDIPTSPRTGFAFDSHQMLNELLTWSNQAIGQGRKPDLIVWPEVPPGMPALDSRLLEAHSIHRPQEEGRTFSTEKRVIDQGQRFHQVITNWVHQMNRSLLVGTFVRDRAQAWESEGNQLENVGICITPTLGLPYQQQSKIRLFPIGEYLPWKQAFFYRWIFAISPELKSYFANLNLAPGKHREVLQLPVADKVTDRTHWRFVISICNEIMFPEDAGVFLESSRNEKPMDFIVNMSNNGGFQRNHASIFHSLLLPFRAVEARVGIARSSNTGISGFVKPTGELYGEVVNDQGQRWTGLGAPELDLIQAIVQLRTEHEDALANSNVQLRNRIEGMMEEVKSLRSKAGISGQSTLPVWIDDRHTLYSQIKDLFAKSCCAVLWLCCVMAIMDSACLKRPRAFALPI